MDITVTNLQKRVPLNPQQICRTAKKILRHENVKQAVLSIVFVSDSRIRELNKKYLKRNHATDVLAFDLRTDNPKRKKTVLEGEIVISTATVARNSRVYSTTLRREILLCVIHGILHLLGYDDHKQNDIKRMRQKEKELLKIISS